MSKRTIRAEITLYEDGSIGMSVTADWEEVEDLKEELSRSEQIRLRHTLGLYRDKIDRMIKEEKQ